MTHSLSAENGAQFWSTVWAENDTGWKHAEKSAPFTRNIFAFLIGTGAIPGAVPIIVSDEQANTPGFMSGAAEAAAVRQFLEGKTVFVPLCGDSAALAFFLHNGARHVIGVDLCKEALHRQRVTNFPGIDFATHVSGNALVHEFVPAPSSGGGRVTLFEGDLTQLPNNEAFASLKVDFVYDRASLMAIAPENRAAYVHAVSTLMTPDTAIAVERMVRTVPSEHAMGPPFMVDMAEVMNMYAASTGREYRATRVLVYYHPGPRHAEWYTVVSTQKGSV